jgi:hypothetical protein
VIGFLDRLELCGGALHFARGAERGIDLAELDTRPSPSDFTTLPPPSVTFCCTKSSMRLIIVSACVSPTDW